MTPDTDTIAQFLFLLLNEAKDNEYDIELLYESYSTLRRIRCLLLRSIIEIGQWRRIASGILSSATDSLCHAACK